MKWLLSILCLTTITAFCQTKEPLLEKLKKTQDRLSGKLSDTMPNQGIGLNRDQKKPRMTIIIPETKKSSPGTIPNLMERYQYKPPVMDANQESMVIALPQDNMPCIVPNMGFWKAMPNAGNKTILEKAIDPGIYLNKPKS
jgi:hypothetical protein